MADSKSTNLVYNVSVNTENGKVKIEGLTKGFVKLDTAIKKVSVDAEKSMRSLSNSTQKLEKNLGQTTDKTGLAGAAVTELGRTISDFNYGMTAMANNISQLGTLFSTLVATTGGLTAGLKAMWKAFTGPLGVIVGIQIVVALMERLAMNAKKAKDEVDGLNMDLSANGGLFA